MKNSVKHNAGKNLLAQSSESTGKCYVPIKVKDAKKLMNNFKCTQIPPKRNKR